MPTDNSTPELINAVMRDHGYKNLQELAEVSRVPYNTIYRWTTGRSNPHRRNLINFLQALGINPDDYGLRTAPTAPDLTEAPAWALEAIEQTRRDHAELLERLTRIEEMICADISHVRSLDQRLTNHLKKV